MKIDNKNVCCDVNPEEIISADEQFLMLLNRLVNWFVDDFPMLVEFRKVIIENIIETNKLQVEKYLLSKHYLGDNSYIDFFCNSINKILFNNFITNIKDMPIVQKFLKDENINYKNINDYTVKELNDLRYLLEKIGICNYDNNFQFAYIFSDIESSIKKKICTYKKEEKRSKKIIDEVTDSTIIFYQNVYSILIQQYKEKRELFL